MTVLARLLYRLGRWLLKPDADRIIAWHTRKADTRPNTRYAMRLDDVALGASYVRDGWDA